MTILLVDDQKTVIEGLLSGVDFNALGFETVRTAYSAEGALNILAENPVDVFTKAAPASSATSSTLTS